MEKQTKTYFSLEELTKSKIAKEMGIDNTPPDCIIPNLEFIISKLNPIREKWGKPIYVNSGYRCPQLNKKVKGKPKSYHLKGLAVDITTGKVEDNKKLFDMISGYFQFDKLIDECNYNWIHIQWNRDKSLNKQAIYHL